MKWPTLKLANKDLVLCVKVAQGGETPIADSRKVLNASTQRLKSNSFKRRSCMSETKGTGSSVENVFQTSNKSEVETYCRNAGIEFEWRGANHLRTRQVCQAVATHPKTSETVWFNQAHLFHVSSLHPKVRESSFND